MAKFLRRKPVIDPTFVIRLARAAGRVAQRRIRVIGSTAWPMADGKVFTGVIQRDDLQGWVASITYSYTALGEYYSGDYRRGFRRKKRAEAFLERLPQNTPILVRYKPDHPDASTVLLADLNLLLAGL